MYSNSKPYVKLSSNANSKINSNSNYKINSTSNTNSNSNSNPKGNFYSKWGVLLLVFMLLIQLFLVFIVPYLVADKKWMSFSESLRLRYGGMNLPKTISYIFIYLFLAALYLIMYLKFNNKYTIIFIVIAYIISSMLFFVYLPQHAAFDNVNYGKLKKLEVNANDDYITFLGVGDVQFFSDYVSTKKSNDETIKNINKFQDEEFKTRYPKHGEIMGLLMPGDCTQTGQDGRFFTHNELGMYESRYGLGGSNSTLKIPVYECNGNHDYDVKHTHKIRYPGKIPSTLMINRKNKYRKIKDQDKKGNYWWAWGELNFIAINVWPSNEKLALGKPEGSLDFLRKNIPKIPSGEKFIILTHYIPHPLGFGELKDFLSADTLVGTPCEALLDIIKDRKKDLLAILTGHIHSQSTERMLNKDGIQIILLPSPLGTTINRDFVLFRYDKAKKELLLTQVGYEINKNRWNIKDIEFGVKLS